MSTYRLKTVSFSVHETALAPAPLSSPEVAVAFLRPIFVGLDVDREHFVMLTLDAQNRVRGFKVVSTGSRSGNLVDPKTLFRDALALGATSLVIAHNHPSGDPTPSREDRSLTLKLAEGGRLLDLPIHDHLILGDGDRYVSMADAGLLLR